LKEENKPVWYDVYAAFPPKKYVVKADARQVQTNEPSAEPRDIFYLEDLIRAKFYRTYGNPGIIDMRDDRVPANSERFVAKYLELEAQGMERSTIFQATTDALNAEGMALKTLAEMEQEKIAAAKLREERKAEAAEKAAAAKAQLQQEADQLTNNPLTMALADDIFQDDHKDYDPHQPKSKS